MYDVVKPILFRMDAERAHEVVTRVFRRVGHNPLLARIIGAVYTYDDPVLATRCAGLRFANPLGLAAGFDKHAELVRPLALLGFGHVEVGTVTPRAQPGNPRPRLFRAPADRALINRMGFNSSGMQVVAHNLRDQGPRTRAKPSLVVGVNIGKNKDTPLERAPEDYVAAFDVLAPLADYVTVNISSPNTPGLRKLHEREALAELLGAVAQRNRALPAPRPIFLKVSPDEGAASLDTVVAAGMEAGCAGFVAVNTTLTRHGLQSRVAAEAGGLSGQPLFARAREVVVRIYRHTGGVVPIIGVGGVSNGDDAFEMLAAGASLVQLYTGLVYGGPGVARRIKHGLAARLGREGVRSVGDIVGSATTT